MRPTVSILIPVRNEERHIERCLYSLARQDYPRSLFEVIVIDGESTDATPRLVSRFAAESTVDLRLLHNPGHTTAAGLNVGLASARSDIIVRLDGHAHAEGDFLSRSVAALSESGADCVGGVLRSEGETYAGQAIALAMSSRFGVGGASFRSGGEGPTDTVAFGAYRREVFERIGRFAEDIDRGEDDEFNYRLLDAGGTILLYPDIHTVYTVRGNFAALWRQYFAYGRAKVEVLRRHPAQARPRHLIPAAFVAACVLQAIPPRRAAGVSALTLYAAATGGASAALAARHGWRYLPALPLAFMTLHVSYGLGFLAGLLRLATSTVARTVRSTAEEGAGAAT